MDKTNKDQVKVGLLEAINTQIEANNPPISRTTFERLCNSGYGEEESKKLMVNVLVHEMFMVNKHNETFDHARFTAMMNALPRVP
jgi:hypothetical protein